ncbi:hypothetical protein LEP1GSC050_3965 [Leptospira broomii serovar Hurstbridge str. 5399]|uniref:Uncharacterized protein n=1 Tax=Leptospira broomii serovar Hurstbridge str. 5399 TaxID=1049789 RepID=T0FBT5_9LEPT|nr:hypothetical protein LEP1GSC050_3965 [Leptospira broomii serovar Hurstbridge str. 5399]
MPFSFHSIIFEPPYFVSLQSLLTKIRINLVNPSGFLAT